MAATDDIEAQLVELRFEVMILRTVVISILLSFGRYNPSARDLVIQGLPVSGSKAAAKIREALEIGSEARVIEAAFDDIYNDIRLGLRDDPTRP